MRPAYRRRRVRSSAVRVVRQARLREAIEVGARRDAAGAVRVRLADPLDEALLVEPEIAMRAHAFARAGVVVVPVEEARDVVLRAELDERRRRVLEDLRERSVRFRHAEARGIAPRGEAPLDLARVERLRLLEGPVLEAADVEAVDALLRSKRLVALAARTEAPDLVLLRRARVVVFRRVRRTARGEGGDRREGEQQTECTLHHGGVPT